MLSVSKVCVDYFDTYLCKHALVYYDCLRIIHRCNITTTLGLLDVFGAAEVDPCPLCEPIERQWRRVWLHCVQEGAALNGNVLSIIVTKIIVLTSWCESLSTNNTFLRILSTVVTMPCKSDHRNLTWSPGL